MHGSQLQILSALFAQRSPSPDPPSKFVYICGVTLQVTSKTPTQRTLLHYISLSKAVHKFSQLLVV